MSLLEQIEAVVKDMTDNNNPPQIVQVSKAHDNNKCDIVTKTGNLRNIDCSGTATAGDKALLVYNEGDAGKPFVLLFADGGGGGGDLSNYYTKTEVNNIVAPLISDSELNTILSSYVTIGFANSRYALINHTHSQYITRAEIHDLDINLTTLELVPKTDNPNGVMCFERVQKTIDELDIDLKADTMSNGYLKIEVDLIEVTRSVNDGNNS